MLPIRGRLSAAAAACCVQGVSVCCCFVEGLFAGPEGPEEGLFAIGHVGGYRVKVLPAHIGKGRSVVVSLEGPSFNERSAIKSLT